MWRMRRTAAVGYQRLGAQGRGMSVPAQRYVDYYRSILKRIADGWDSPVTLASLALEWTLHDEGCSFNKGDFGECDCSASDAGSKGVDFTNDTDSKS